MGSWRLLFEFVGMRALRGLAATDDVVQFATPRITLAA
jgi:hypothetical protein